MLGFLFFAGLPSYWRQLSSIQFAESGLCYLFAAVVSPIRALAAPGILLDLFGGLFRIRSASQQHAGEENDVASPVVVRALRGTPSVVEVGSRGAAVVALAVDSFLEQSFERQAEEDLDGQH